MEKPRAWAHLHLPRLRSGETEDVISLKVPGWAIDYVSVVELSDAEFKVHESGRQRCIREGVRNVHAWVIGGIERQEYGKPRTFQLAPHRWEVAVYDPFKGGTFVNLKTLEPVHRADFAILIGKNVFYRNEV